MPAPVLSGGLLISFAVIVAACVSSRGSSTHGEHIHDSAKTDSGESQEASVIYTPSINEINDVSRLSDLCSKNSKSGCLKLGLTAFEDVTKQVVKPENFRNTKSVAFTSLSALCGKSGKIKNEEACATVALIWGFTKDLKGLDQLCGRGSAHACFQIGVVQFERGKDKQSDKTLQVFLKSCTKEVWDGCHYAGEFYVAKKQLGDALSSFLKACNRVRDWPEDSAGTFTSAVRSCGRAGQISLEVGNYSRAEELLIPDCDKGNGSGSSCTGLVSLATKTRN